MFKLNFKIVFPKGFVITGLVSVLSKQEKWNGDCLNYV